MGTGVLLTIGSLFYVTVLSVVYFKKMKLNTLENRIFKRIIISNICGLLLHLILFCMMCFIGIDNIYTIIISKLYLVYLITYMTLFTIYTLIISTKNRTFLEENFRKIIIGGILIITIVSLFIFYLPIEFHNESSKMYSFGPSVELVYIFGFLIIGFNVVLLFKNIKRALNKEYYPLLFYFTLGLLASIVQYKYPYVQLITSIHSFIIFLMYLTIENPDIRMAKDLAYAKEVAEKSNNNTIKVLDDLERKLQSSLSKLETFGYKKTDTKNTLEMEKDLKYIKKYCINFVDKINGLIDINKITSGNLKINESEYETNNLIKELENILSKEIIIKKEKLPLTLYGDKDKIKQTILLIYKYLSSKGNTEVKLDYLLAGRFCRLKFHFTTNDIELYDYIYDVKDYKNRDNNYIFYDNKDNIEYDKIIKLLSLIEASTEIKTNKDKSKELIISIDQRIKSPYVLVEEQEENKGIKVRYFNLSNKRILLLDNSSKNIREMLLLLKPYKVNIDIARNLDNLKEYLSSNKTYDLIFIDEVIYKKNKEDFSINQYKRFIGYIDFKSIIMISNDNIKFIDKYLNDGYTDYITKPINKKNINKVLKKHLK